MPRRLHRLLPALSAAFLALPAMAATAEGPRTPGADSLAPGATAPASSSPASAAPTAREKQLLERIQQLKGDPMRSFGACRYAWSRWRMGDNGVRLTEVQCGGEPVQKGTVAVHCDSLRINRKMGEGSWETWRLPLSVRESTSSGGEDLMVATLCANVKPTSTPSAAPPAGAPTTTPAPATAKPGPAPAGGTARP